MFELKASEAREIRSANMNELLKNISKEIAIVRLKDQFQVHYDLPFDQMTYTGRNNHTFVCSTLEKAGYEVETSEHINCIIIRIPVQEKSSNNTRQTDPTPEGLMWAVTGMNWADGLLKDLTKCCAKQIKEDETGILTQRYDAQCDKFALGMDMATITYCVIETVLPGMGNAFITRSYDKKIS